MTAVAGEGTVHLTSSRARQRQEHPITTDPIVGKDILELLSSAMYVDPRTIFREYIQNAADAIDEAFDAGLLRDDELARIDVTLDSGGRTIRIRDNGVGVPADLAERVLTSFGASAKRGTTARGFRGVGRLAAFGYAQTVAFKTKTAGESVSTEVRWDCRRLKVALLDPKYKGDLRQIVRDVVTVVSEEEFNTSLHYFEVRLERVVRIKNDVLLNPDEVQHYLSQVAPAPFHKEFQLGLAIRERLEGRVPRCRFQIFVNASAEPITRPHRAELAITPKKLSRVSEIEFIELPDGDGGLRAVIWLIHHEYLGAFHSDNDLRGLRARIGDMQIGDADIFAEAFPEARFNSWTVGELHVLDRRIIPNGRRDGFEQNGAYTDLVAQLVPLGRAIARRCRQSSARRNRLRGFELRTDRIRELFAVLTQRAITRTRELKTRREIGTILGEMRKLASSTLLTDEDQKRLKRHLLALQSKYEGLEVRTGRSDPLAGLPPGRRAAYEHAIELIYDCSPNKAVARVLVERMLDRLAALTLRPKRRRDPRKRRM